MGAGKQGGREAFKNKQTSDSVSTQEPGSEAAGTPIQAVITPFSTLRVARPQPTRQPHSQTRDRSWLKLGRPRGISASSPSTRDPRGEQGPRTGQASAGPPSSSHPVTLGELGAPPLPGARGRRCTSRSPARPPPPPSSLPVRISPKGRGGEGRDPAKKDPELRGLKVKGAEGRSGGLPRRPGPRASSGDQPSRGGAHQTHRDVTTLSAHARAAFHLLSLALKELYRGRAMSVPRKVE